MYLITYLITHVIYIYCVEHKIKKRGAVEKTQNHGEKL